MIPNQWYVILESDEVPQSRPVAMTRLGERLAVWRDAQGRVTCMLDPCPHRGASLSAGAVVRDRIECPFHGFQYDVSGRCTLIPANGAGASIPKAFQVKAFPTSEAHGFVWMWWGESRAELPPLPFFDSIDEAYSYSTLRDHWNVHYSRAIENQLDVVHLPFVHRTTIGRGGRTLVDGPVVRWARPATGDAMNLWVYNRVDDGTPPRRPQDMPEPQRHPFLQFHFPNLWHNWISDSVRIVVAFAPVDNENTVLYVRFYQNRVHLPVFQQAFNFVGKISNRVILQQDKRVVLTQRPKASDLRMGEKLIQGDGPIIEYRRRRRELIDAASPRVSDRPGHY